MTDVLLFLSYTAAGWVRITLGLLLMWLLLSTRRPGAASLGLALAGAAALALLPLFFSLPAFYGVALETVWLVLCASRFQGAPPRMSLFVGIFYEIALSLGQFLVAAWLGVLFRNAAFLHTASPQGQAAFWLLHALLLILSGFLWRNPDRAGKVAFRGITGVAVVGLLASLDFERAFVVFHALFFPGKDNWLFDPAVDQIILILPEVFFRNCALLIGGLILLWCAILIGTDLWLGRRRR